MARSQKNIQGQTFLFFGTQVVGHIDSNIFLGIFSECPTFKHQNQHGINSGVPSPGVKVSTDPLLSVRLQETLGFGRSEHGGNLKKYLKKSKAREQPVL
jgi:hypothetical protein